MRGQAKIPKTDIQIPVKFQTPGTHGGAADSLEIVTWNLLDVGCWKFGVSSGDNSG
jgi:hypothetical protein